MRATRWMVWSLLSIGLLLPAGCSGSSSSDGASIADTDRGVCDAMRPATDDVGRIKSGSASPDALLQAYQKAALSAPAEVKADLQTLIDFGPTDARLRGGSGPNLSAMATLKTADVMASATAGVRMNSWLGTHCHGLGPLPKGP